MKNKILLCITLFSLAALTTIPIKFTTPSDSYQIAGRMITSSSINEFQTTGRMITSSINEFQTAGRMITSSINEFQTAEKAIT
ncbi:hypothetical protein P4U97_05410 [Bacillus swezeyi]|uniref:hypothetical protein n=1 Tax=Bacillus swezeyi TaxID=1925020 RepID=UPI0027DB04AD|nr:hypothetical protein [Bacillus swezeyi]MED1738942.1 hypothetical protein [Bacillus swezeyi]